MFRLMSLLLVFLFLISCSGTGQVLEPGSGEKSVFVIRVTDGDTIGLGRPIKEVVGDQMKYITRVRYIGIDTPESDEPFYKAARELNKSLVYRKRVRLVFDKKRTDRGNRLLCYVYVGDLFVNAEMVKRGYAREDTFDNSTHERLFKKLEAEARQHKRGMWKYIREPGADSKQPPVVGPDQGEYRYTASKNSDVFHLPSCTWAERISKRNKIHFRTFKAAVGSDRRPCRVCNPKDEDGKGEG